MKDLTIVDNLRVVDTIIVNEQEIQFKTDGDEIFTDSLTVARVFGKRHDNVLRDIEDEIGLLKIEESVTSGFIACNYQARNLKQEKFYYMTQDAFTDLIMNFTGAKAKAWKKEYRIAFNKVVESHRGLTATASKLLEDNIKLKAEAEAREQALLPKTRESLDLMRRDYLAKIKNYFISKGENERVFTASLIRVYNLLHIYVVGDIAVNILRDRVTKDIKSHNSGHSEVYLADYIVALNYYNNTELDKFNNTLSTLLKETCEAIDMNVHLTPARVINDFNTELLTKIAKTRNIFKGSLFTGKLRSQLDDLIVDYTQQKITTEAFNEAFTALKAGRTFKV